MPRKEMPQFEDAADVEKLDRAVRSLGKTVKNRSVDPFRLRPMQRYVSYKKAKQIDPTNTGSRILVSDDGGIIDGHHRWAAAHLRKRKGKLPKKFHLKIREYEMGATDLLKLAQKISLKRHKTFKKI